jgi:hypothetical protein
MTMCLSSVVLAHWISRDGLGTEPGSTDPLCVNRQEMRTRVPLYWEDVLAGGTSQPVRGDTREVQSSHAATTVDVVVDGPKCRRWPV